MSLLPWRRKAAPAPRAAGADTAHPLVLRNERMASRLSGVHFTVRIDGAWRWTHSAPSDLHDPAAAARDHLRRHAAKVLRRHSVLSLAAAEDAANTVLGRWSPVAGLEALGAVHLEASASDRDLAEEHARRQQAIDLAHEEELHRLARLQHVLAHPELRRVWWIAQFPDRFGELTGLADALQGLPLPHEVEDDDIRGDIRRFTEQLVTDLHTPQQREIFLQALIQTLQTLGQHDLKAAASRWQTPSESGSTPA